MQAFIIELFGRKFTIEQDGDGRFILPDKLRQWKNRGSALKPAWEPIIVAMKPLDGTFAHNAEKWGVAGLNIEGSRIGKSAGDRTKYGVNGIKRKTGNVFGKQYGEIQFDGSQGRWPANVILDEEAGAMLDEQSGVSKSSGGRIGKKNISDVNIVPAGQYKKGDPGFGDIGGASRFFYCAKASRAERNAGLEGMPEGTKVWDGKSPKSSKDMKPLEQRWTTKMQNIHPTVKPLKLMEYLCKLTMTPTGGIVLDPFAGSGTTCMACIKTGRNYIGIEKDAGYCEITRKRIEGLSCGATTK